MSGKNFLIFICWDSPPLILLNNNLAESKFLSFLRLFLQFWKKHTQYFSNIAFSAISFNSLELLLYKYVNLLICSPYFNYCFFLFISCYTVSEFLSSLFQFSNSLSECVQSRVSPVMAFFYFLFLATLCGLRDLSSLTRDWNWPSAVKAWSPNHWTSRDSPVTAF